MCVRVVSCRLAADLLGNVDQLAEGQAVDAAEEDEGFVEVLRDRDLAAALAELSSSKLRLREEEEVDLKMNQP